jgi:desulfoferrodoxin (superoxide reductase-like protein)
VAESWSVAVSQWNYSKKKTKDEGKGKHIPVIEKTETEFEIKAEKIETRAYCNIHGL